MLQQAWRHVALASILTAASASAVAAVSASVQDINTAIASLREIASTSDGPSPDIDATSILNAECCSLTPRPDGVEEAVPRETLLFVTGQECGACGDVGREWRDLLNGIAPKVIRVVEMSVDSSGEDYAIRTFVPAATIRRIGARDVFVRGSGINAIPFSMVTDAAGQVQAAIFGRPTAKAKAFVAARLRNVQVGRPRVWMEEDTATMTSLLR